MIDQTPAHLILGRTAATRLEVGMGGMAEVLSLYGGSGFFFPQFVALWGLSGCVSIHSTT